jgi:hypothetical protein
MLCHETTTQRASSRFPDQRVLKFPVHRILRLAKQYSVLILQEEIHSQCQPSRGAESRIWKSAL